MSRENLKKPIATEIQLESIVSKISPPEIGFIGLTTWYADNEKILQDISFSLPYDEWLKLQETQLYSDLVAYFLDLQTRYKDYYSHESLSGQDWTKKQPNTVFIDDVEVPSYQNFWERTMKIENKIDYLKISMLVLAIVNAVLFASVMAIVLRLLK